MHSYECEYACGPELRVQSEAGEKSSFNYCCLTIKRRIDLVKTRYSCEGCGMPDFNLL